MLSKNETMLIVDHVLSNEDNLKIACKIHCIFDKEIRKKIIVDFAQKLENELKKYLDDKWEIKNDFKEDAWNYNYKRFFITNKEWKFNIGIESQLSGEKNFVIGIKKDEKNTAIELENVKSMLDNKYKPGKSSQYWIWYRYIDNIYQNWDAENEESLIELHRKDEAAKYFKEEILKIKEIVSPPWR